MFVSDQPIASSGSSGLGKDDRTTPAERDLDAAARVLALLRREADRDPSFRESLLELSSLFRRVAGIVEADAPRTPGAPSASPQSDRARPPAVTAAPRHPSRALLPLRIGDARADVVVPAAAREAIPLQARSPADEHEARRAAELADERAPHAGGPRTRSLADAPDLSLAARRARLKAEALRRVIAQERSGDVASDAAQSARLALVSRARELPQCRLWMLESARSGPSLEGRDLLAEVYENLAIAAELALELEAARADEVERLRNDVWPLLAEAQSALRRAILDAGLEVDADQNDAFYWLRARTEVDRVFVARHMRLDDPADPEVWQDLRRRLGDAAEVVRSVEAAGKATRRLLSKLRFIAGKLGEEALEAEDALVHWRAIDAALAQAPEPSRDAILREARDLLLPLRGTMPEAFEPGAALDTLLEMMDARLERDSSSTAARERGATEEVRRVAELLRGSVVLLIGGERRRQAEAALRDAFELSELRWIATREHQSIAPFESEVARADVALVLLPIRWASHSFEGVQAFCERYGKPFVRLPAGYHPNRVAVEILAQAERQLVDDRD